MEVVATEDEAQTVLSLEGMEGAQYMTLPERYSLNEELISEGMVVDMINGVTTDYTSGAQYYENDDVLREVMTEEDQKLAEALVAVQLEQHQKQQIPIDANHGGVIIEEVSNLEDLPPVDPYQMQTIEEHNQPQVYSLIQTFKRGTHMIKTEFVDVKCEEELDISAESSEDAVQTPGIRRSLPHKKRIAKKLKQQSKKVGQKKDSASLDQTGVIVTEVESKSQGNIFKCEICGMRCNAQLTFFEHLKSHYEPVKEEKKTMNQPVNNNITINMLGSSVQGVVENVIEEFSEPEDLMEGIRDVVEETGAHIDDDEDDDGQIVEEDPLPETTNDSTVWTIDEVQEHIEQEDMEEPQNITQQVSFELDSSKTSETVKKKRQKSKKPPDELTCTECRRSFHHKNSLVYHMRSHSGERPHQCEICGKSFFAASALKVHKRLHSGDKPYKCEDCGRHFRQWGDLKYHSTSLHSEQRQFQCEYCGKDFARKYSLIVHRRIHTGEKNYRCEYCNKTFRASSYLQNHRRIHTGEKPHPCDVCGKPFRVRSDMKRHMLTHSRSTNRVDRAATKTAVAKSTPNNDGSIADEESLDKRRTINEIVHELKLEVEPCAAAAELAAAVAAASAGNDDQSILPHVNVQTLEYVTQANNGDTPNDRDPLGAVVRTDGLLVDFQLF
ncbi:zinc finger protein 37 homolog [Trichogramma pretiosum]|uniref:zinc finger protein 37 homolog n=1 Tax=Trichogramma pretiosum TaxID=7493 RepID=UPI0006C9CA7D|nr:zinc finger protein 37 homolog [Trichogramma pretiosum]